jgi:hypothetical protein
MDIDEDSEKVLHVNIYPAIKTAQILFAVIFVWCIGGLILQYRDIEWQKQNYEFFECEFNITTIRKAKGVTAIVGVEILNEICHNWKGIDSQYTMKRGDIEELSQIYGIIAAISAILWLLIYKKAYLSSSGSRFY